MSQYAVVPLAYTDSGWNIGTDYLSRAWEEMVAHKKDRDTFYDGGVNSASDFIGWCHEGGRTILFAMNRTDLSPLMMCWITDLRNGVGQIHFTVISPCNVVRVGTAFLEVLRSIPSGAGRAIRVLTGITPASNPGAVRFAELMGFRRVGEIPDYCHVGDGSWEAGVITYWKPED